jgi:hypothetical protein
MDAALDSARARLTSMFDAKDDGSAAVMIGLSGADSAGQGASRRI